MTLQELRYLVAVADHLHFHRAAAACRVSQPTLSAQLQKLEQSLGLTLVNRHQPRRIHLTPAGEQVVRKARRIIADADTILALGTAQSTPPSVEPHTAASQDNAPPPANSVVNASADSSSSPPSNSPTNSSMNSVLPECRA